MLVDGKDVRTLTQHSLRANIGIVQQDVFLFAGTIYDNIRYGRPDATEAEIVEAAKRAEIYDDILDMPDGFQTQVGERGAMLSGGQKQRVSIARIFLKNPPVLILDEATSALDSVTEARIQSAFDELAKGRTTLIIAHRLSTIRSASRILVIDGNGIQEEGPMRSLWPRAENTHSYILRRNRYLYSITSQKQDGPGGSVPFFVLPYINGACKNRTNVVYLNRTKVLFNPLGLFSTQPVYTDRARDRAGPVRSMGQSME